MVVVVVVVGFHTILPVVSKPGTFLYSDVCACVCVFCGRCQARLGTKWAAIAREIPGRTEHAVKGRFKVRDASYIHEHSSSTRICMEQQNKATSPIFTQQPIHPRTLGLRSPLLRTICVPLSRYDDTIHTRYTSLHLTAVLAKAGCCRCCRRSACGLGSSSTMYFSFLVSCVCRGEIVILIFILVASPPPSQLVLLFFSIASPPLEVL